MTQIYVSITGLELNAIWHVPRFWSLAAPALVAAQRAPGNITAEACTIQGVHHTLSVWEDERFMRAYLRGSAHLKAMRAFPKIATGKTYGYWAKSVPDWLDARKIWETYARLYRQPVH